VPVALDYSLICYLRIVQEFRHLTSSFVFSQVKNGISKAGNLTDEISSVEKFERLEPLESMEAYDDGGEGDGLAEDASQVNPCGKNLFKI